MSSAQKTEFNFCLVDKLTTRLMHIKYIFDFYKSLYKHF